MIVEIKSGQLVVRCSLCGSAENLHFLPSDETGRAHMDFHACSTCIAGFVVLERLPRDQQTIRSVRSLALVEAA